MTSATILDLVLPVQFERYTQRTGDTSARYKAYAAALEADADRMVQAGQEVAFKVWGYPEGACPIIPYDTPQSLWRASEVATLVLGITLHTQSEAWRDDLRAVRTLSGPLMRALRAEGGAESGLEVIAQTVTAHGGVATPLHEPYRAISGSRLGQAHLGSVLAQCVDYEVRLLVCDREQRRLFGWRLFPRRGVTLEPDQVLAAALQAGIDLTELLTYTLVTPGHVLPRSPSER